MKTLSRAIIFSTCVGCAGTMVAVDNWWGFVGFVLAAFLLPESVIPVEDVSKRPKKDKADKIGEKTAKNLELVSAFCDHIKETDGIDVPEPTVVAFFEKD